MPHTRTDMPPIHHTIRPQYSDSYCTYLPTYVSKHPSHNIPKSNTMSVLHRTPCVCTGWYNYCSCNVCTHVCCFFYYVWIYSLQKKRDILTFLTSEIFSLEDIMLHLVLASGDTRQRSAQAVSSSTGDLSYNTCMCSYFYACVIWLLGMLVCM